MPMVAERENPEQTADLCLQLFSALGVKGVSIQDIETAHRVPSMKPSNRPNAIVCKFVRRLAKDQVMAARTKVGRLKAEELGFAGDINVKYLNIGQFNNSLNSELPTTRDLDKLHSLYDLDLRNMAFDTDQTDNDALFFST